MTDHASELGKIPRDTNIFTGDPLPPFSLHPCRCGLVVPSPPCPLCSTTALQYVYGSRRVLGGPRATATQNHVPVLLAVFAFVFALWIGTILDSHPHANDQPSQLD